MKAMIKIILSVFAVMFVCSSKFYAVDRFAKVVLVGDSGSGKTSLWKRVVEGDFDQNENRSDMMICKDIIKKVDEKEVQFNIWDTAGAEIYYNEVVDFTKGANFVIIVHDTSIKFDESREKYLAELYKNIYERIDSCGKIMIVGNKWDLRHSNIVNSGKHKSLLESVAQSIPCSLKFVSCKENSGDIKGILDYLCAACKKMKLYTSNPDKCLQKRFTVKVQSCAIL